MPNGESNGSVVNGHAGGMSEPSLTERRGRETIPLWGAFLFAEGESGGVPFATDRMTFCFKNSFVLKSVKIRIFESKIGTSYR